MKKFGLLLVILICFSLVMFGCSAQTENPPDEPQEPESPGTEEPAEEPVKVALILNGPISDMGWNASGYDGLMSLEENYGAVVSYKEMADMSDFETDLRFYAQAGNDIIFGHGAQFTDSILAVAPDFPDTMFIIVNGSAFQEPNVASALIPMEEQGFLMGALAALASESGHVAFIGGEEMPPIRAGEIGFRQGVSYVNSGYNAATVMAGTFDDVAKIKETTYAMIEGGADVVTGMANQGGMGIVEAAGEKGIYAIGANSDQNSLAPDSVVVSVLKDVSKLYSPVYEKFVDGTLKAEVISIGATADLFFYSDWHGFDTKLPELKQEADRILGELSSGNIEVTLE